MRAVNVPDRIPAGMLCCTAGMGAGCTMVAAVRSEAVGIRPARGEPPGRARPGPVHAGGMPRDGTP